MLLPAQQEGHQHSRLVMHQIMNRVQLQALRCAGLQRLDGVHEDHASYMYVPSLPLGNTPKAHTGWHVLHVS